MSRRQAPFAPEGNPPGLGLRNIKSPHAKDALPPTPAFMLGRSQGESSMSREQVPVTHTEAEWRALLTPEQYAIMREHATERPGSCALLAEKRAGVFSCAGCGEPLPTTTA